MNQIIDNCVDILNNSGVILYPTDTIWGIGCNALDENAIQKIYSIKQRPISKSLIILVESEKRLQDLVDVPNLAWDIIDLSEKPVTIIYENPKKLPKSIIAEDNTIAIRLTKDVFCKKLISKLNAPLISTSANIHGAETAKNYSQISEEIKNQMDYIVPLRQNETSEQNASSIIKINHNGVVKIIRE